MIMHSKWHPAPSSLSGVLAGIWSVQAAADADLFARVLPDGTTCLVFQSDGTILRSSDNAWQPWGVACVSGPRTGPFDFQLSADGQIFIVQLQSAGAQQTLGVPMSLLADRFEELGAVVGSGSGQQFVTDFVLGGADEVACVQTIEKWLLERTHKQSTKCAVTEALVQEVTGRCGRIGIEELARQFDLSRRHLGRVMNERIGVSPKQFARIIRFHEAVQLGRIRPTMSLARIALMAGYADQAHMSREFAVLGGIRPSDLRGPTAASIW